MAIRGLGPEQRLASFHCSFADDPLNGPQSSRNHFLARLGPAQVVVHFLEEFVYRRVRQQLARFRPLKRWLVRIATHNSLILLPKRQNTTTTIGQCPALRLCKTLR